MAMLVGGLLVIVGALVLLRERQAFGSRKSARASLVAIAAGALLLLLPSRRAPDPPAVGETCCTQVGDCPLTTTPLTTGTACFCGNAFGRARGAVCE